MTLQHKQATAAAAAAFHYMYILREKSLAFAQSRDTIPLEKMK
jgi:hypothetical protein